MNDAEKIKALLLRLEHYVWALAVVWTIVVAASLVWNVAQMKHETLEAARIQARVAYEKDVTYRRWNAGHGGVYVPVTEATQPNPYLSDVPERDITTPSGKLLTLMNPAYMTRQVHELSEKEYGVRGHITSLNPIRPENAPDPWEAEALQAFERGETEIGLVEEMEGEEYMRLMRPLITEKSCLECHAKQGYQEGDIRGGISVSVPMEPLRAIERKRILTFALAHGLLWLAGLSGIVLGTQRLRRSEREQKRAEEALRNALEESQQRQAEIAALLEGSRAVLEYREFKDAAQSIFDLCKNLIGATGGYVALLSEDGSENEVLFLDSGGRSCSVDPLLPMPIRGLRGEAYCTGKAIYHNDFSNSEWVDFMPAGHLTLDNVLFAPLVIEGKTVGLLGLGNKTGGFTEHDAAMASAFGELAAVALYNSRTLESLENSQAETARRNSELAAQNAIAATISQSLELDAILNAALDRVLEVMSVDAAGIFLVEGDQLDLRAYRNLPPHFVTQVSELRVGESLPGLVAQTGEPIVVQEEVSKDPRLAKEPEREEGFQSFVCVPLKARGKVVGVMPMATYQRREFSPDDVALLTAIGQQIGVAVENARLYERVREERVEEQATLLRLSHEFLASLEPEEIMRRTVATAAQALDADCSDLMLLDEDEQILTLGFSHGREHLIGRLEIPNTDDSFPGYIVRQKTPVIIEDTASDGRFQTVPLIEEISVVVSSLGVPVMAGEKAIGALIVDTQKPRLFSPEEAHFLSLIANQAGMALEKVGLFDALSERSRRLRRLYDLAVTMAGDVTRVADQVVSIIAELLDIEVALVERLEDETIRAIAMYDHGQIIHEGEFPLPGTPCERVRLEKQPCIYNQVAERFPEDPFLRERGLVAYVGLPVLDSRGEVIAVVNAMDDRPREFSTEDLELLHTLAQRVGLELERAEAEAEVRRRAGELQAIAEVGGLVTAGGDLQATLDTLAEKIAQATGFEAVGIGLYDAQREVLTYPSLYSTVTMAVLEGRKGSTIHLEDAPVLQYLLREKRHLMLDDPQNDPQVRESQQELARRDGVQAVLTMPLLFGQELVGALDLISTRQRVFSPEDVALLTTLADQVATAIHNAHLYQEAQQRLARLTALGEVHRAITSTLNLDEVLAILLENIIEVSHADTATVMLIRPDSDQLESIVSMGVEEEKLEATLRLKVGEGAAGWVATEGEPLAITDVLSDPRFIRKDLAAETGIVAYLGVPLQAKGKVIGVLNLSTRQPHEFSPEEVDFLATLGGEATMAIENSRLYGQVEERAWELNREVIAQKQYAETVLRSVADGVYSTDRERRVLTWSQGAEAITGLRAEEVLGRSCDEFLRHTDEAGRVLCDTPDCPLTTVMTSGRPIPTRQVYAHTVEGPLVPVAVTAAPIFDEQGQVVGAVEVFRDVSKEQELMESIQAANQAKSEFLAAMSHELRTPLNAVIGFSEVLQEQYFGELNEKQARYVGDILESGKHLLSLINDVLDLSKIEAGKEELELSQVSIEDLLENSLVMIREKAMKHGIGLDLHISQDVEGLEITADERKLRQVMFNLLSNAAKFTPDGGVITVGAGQEGEELLISVTDTGIGIAPEHQEKIFEEFYQVRGGMTDKTPGTGLGLSLTRRFVEMHGGGLWVESEGEGKGSRFSFTLPLTRLVNH